ncbi:MAG: ABC transporter substrate-binding protein [Parachlamydiaceae bacterium]|nr:ABC transporter substrate-binding protein [Parachlamydiaceae bacterium]
MKTKFPSIYPIIFSFTFIFSWWFFAFENLTTSTTTSSENTLESPGLALSTHAILSKVSQLDRNEIQQALAGNFSLMRELIQRWETDAKHLSDHGIPGIQHLSKDQYFQSCFIEHILSRCPKSIKDQLNRSLRLNSLVDASNRKVTILDSFNRFLPQSYISASYLLAIAPSDEILAIPKGLRYLSHIYNPVHLNKIPKNSHQIVGEKLSQSKPDIVFTAPYSHPPLLEMLQRQKINLYNLHHQNTLKEIQQSLLKVGHLSNHILEAQLLSHFIDSCFLAIDNRLLVLNYFDARTPISLLCLTLHQSFELPTSKSLIGQLLNRATSFYPQIQCRIPSDENAWSISTNIEKIYLSNSDVLFICTSLSAQQKKDQNHFILGQLKAFKNNKIFYFDSALHNSANQYIALAYFDLFQSLTSMMIL